MGVMAKSAGRRAQDFTKLAKEVASDNSPHTGGGMIKKEMHLFINAQYFNRMC